MKSHSFIIYQQLSESYQQFCSIYLAFLATMMQSLFMHLFVSILSPTEQNAFTDEIYKCGKHNLDLVQQDLNQQTY